MYGRSGAGAAEFGKKVFVMAHCAPTRRGWEIGPAGPVISTVIDWLYLAGKGPHHPPRTTTEEANCSSSNESVQCADEQGQSSLIPSTSQPRQLPSLSSSARAGIWIDSLRLPSSQNIASLLLTCPLVRLLVLCLSGSNVYATNTTGICSRLLST